MHQQKQQFSQQLQQNIHKVINNIFALETDDLNYKVAPSKWSKKEILGHLIDSARYNLMRFTEIPLSKEVYTISGYQQNELVVLNNYQQIPLAELVDLWKALNTQIVRIIENLNEEGLQRTILTTSEQKDLAWLIQDYIAHLEHHLKQIFK